MKNRGSSLVELLLYTGLLTTILVVLYQLFALAAFRKIGEVVQDEIYYNSSHLVADLSRTIQQSTSIEEPALGATSSRLRLNGGATVYQLDGDNRLVKTEGSTTTFLTNPSVLFNALSFTRRGPSVQSPTVSIDFTLAGRHDVEGRQLSEQFITAVTVR